MYDDPRGFDECDDELLDREYPDEDLDEEDAGTTVACSHCGAEVYDDAFQCPVCGEYLEHPTSPLAGRPLWWVVLGLVGFAAAILILVGLAR